MPGEIATYLLGAQGGVEDDFARLYEATNPVLVRYLRVTADAVPADLALRVWATALRQLKVCAADDDAWLELVVGSARAAAAAGSPGGDRWRSSTDTASADPDDVDRAIAALRTCPPDQAEVLAMGLIANLGREATARLTGHEPSAVLALVQSGLEHLEMSLEELITALRAPGRPHEVADLGLVTPLMTAALTGPVPTPAAATVPTPIVVTGARRATRAAGTGAGLSERSLVDPSGTGSTGTRASSVVHLTAVGSATGTPSRSVRTAASAAAWLLAVGGVGTAAAMSGLITAAIDGIRGGRDGGPPVTAHGPVRPGTPSTDDGATKGEPPDTSSPGTGTDGPTPGPTQPAEPPGSGGDGTAQPVTLSGESTGPTIVLTSYVVPTGSTPSTPTVAPTTPTTPPEQETPVPPPSSANGNTHAKGQGNGKAAKGHGKAKGHDKHHHGKAKGHDKGKGNAHGNAKGHDKA